MEIEDKYVKASRYNRKASSHNFQVFHRRLTARPLQAVSLAFLMGMLAVNGFFNLIDSPRWDARPWMGWMIGAIALLPAGYFLFCAVVGTIAFFSNGKK